MKQGCQIKTWKNSPLTLNELQEADSKKQKTETAASTNPIQAEANDAPPSASKKQKLSNCANFLFPRIQSPHF